MNQQLPQKPRSNQMDKVRGLTGVAMGLVYVFVGVFMVFANQKKILQLGATTAWLVASLSVIYGLFRIWRGWQIRKKSTQQNKI